MKVVGVKRRAELKVEVPKHQGSGSSVSPQLGRHRNAPCINLRGFWLQKLLYFTQLVKKWSENKGVVHPKSELQRRVDILTLRQVSAHSPSCTRKKG